jgi:hypothetical protein
MINEKQALEVAVAIFSKEKGVKDFGLAVMRESAEVFTRMLEVKKLEDEIKRPTLRSKPVTKKTQKRYDKLFFGKDATNEIKKSVDSL